MSYPRTRARWFATLALLIGVGLASTAAAGDRWEPSAEIRFSGWVGGIGIGYTSLRGVLDFEGETYGIEIVGTSAVDIGLTYVRGSGLLYGLRDVRELAGRFRGFAISGTPFVGGHGGRWQNRAGVYLETRSCSYGLGLGLAASPIRIFVHGAEGH